MRVSVQLFCLAVVLGPYAVSAQDEKTPPMEGKRADANGNITWKSTGDFVKAKKQWAYSGTVKNLDTQRRCRFIWTFGKTTLKTITAPKEEHTLWDYERDVKPADQEGKLKYNGGQAAGEGEAAAPVWRPKQVQGAAAKNSRGRLKLGFELGKELYQVNVSGESSVEMEGETTSITYLLKVTPHLPAGVRVRWKSIY